MAVYRTGSNSKRKRLGQHLLVDMKILDKIVSAAEISNTERVCEAGTGTGVLTSKLCERAGTVISFEVDVALFNDAKVSVKRHHNLEIVNSDLFAQNNVKFDVFVSNLPYSRSRDAIQWLAMQTFKRAIIMVQREFADKLLAKPGNKNYRAITVLAQYCFTIERIFRVGRDAFDPMPEVESEVIRLVPTRTVTRQTIRDLNTIFSQRNKRFSSIASRFELDHEPDQGCKRLRQLDPETIMRAINSGELAASRKKS